MSRTFKNEMLAAIKPYIDSATNIANIKDIPEYSKYIETDPKIDLAKRTCMHYVWSGDGGVKSAIKHDDATGSYKCAVCGATLNINKDEYANIAAKFKEMLDTIVHFLPHLVNNPEEIAIVQTLRSNMSPFVKYIGNYTTLIGIADKKDTKNTIGETYDSRITGIY